jgi:hypothetical protein
MGVDHDYCVVCMQDVAQLSPKIAMAPSGGSKVNPTQVTLLHIMPFCEGPNKKPKGFAKQKQKI